MLIIPCDIQAPIINRVVRFGKKGKLAPRFVGPFEITKRIGPVAYRLRQPEELNGVHDTFHVSNLKKCLADPTLQIPLDEIRVDAKLNFVEEPVVILEREFKKLKRSRIAIVKVRMRIRASYKPPIDYTPLNNPKNHVKALSSALEQSTRIWQRVLVFWERWSEGNSSLGCKGGIALLKPNLGTPIYT
ncbi:hypothetical protein Tco_1316200 [Tanacetum coccineum]